MKNLRMYLSAFAVLAIVSSALAFKGATNFGQGQAFCTAPGNQTGACPTSALVNFVLDPQNGTTTTPCAGITGTTGHINSGGNCVDENLQKFSVTLPGK